MSWKFSAFWGTSPAGCSKLHSTCTDEQFRLGKKFLKILSTIFFQHAGISDEKNPAFCQEVFDGFVKTAFNLFRGKLWKMFSLKKLYFFVFFGRWILTFPTFLQRNFHRAVETAFQVKKKNILVLWKKSPKISKKKDFFRYSENLSWMISASWQNILDGVVKCTDDPFSFVKNLPKIIWRNISFVFLRHWPKVLRLYVKFFWPGCQNCILCVGRKTLKGHVFWNKSPFQDIERKLSALFQRVFKGFVKVAFSVSRRRLWGKLIFFDDEIDVFCQFQTTNSLGCEQSSQLFLKTMFFLSFWDIERNYSGLLSKRLRRVCQNCIRCVQRTTWKFSYSGKSCSFC